jgi:hypothetical protein
MIRLSSKNRRPRKPEVALKAAVSIKIFSIPFIIVSYKVNKNFNKGREN